MRLSNLVCGALMAAWMSCNPHAVWPAEPCTTSLATGIDVSGSVSREELVMQVDGIIEALHSPAVISAMQSQGCARIAVFVWGDLPPVVLLPWTDVGSIEQAEQAGMLLTAAAADYNSPKISQLTDVAQALQFAWALLNQMPPTGRQVVNIVSNGTQNTTGDPLAVSQAMKAAGVTINAVVFGSAQDLETWWRQNITGGRSSFVMHINGPADIAAAYRAKFILDLAAAE